MRTPPARSSYDLARERFPSVTDVDHARLARVDELKVAFLTRQPEPDEGVAEYFQRYRSVFSDDGLDQCDPMDLKDFANVDTGARAGNQSMFNSAWNEMGTGSAATRTRHAIRHVLYGPERSPLEDRLTDVIEDDKGQFMPGFKEALLTKVLCVVHPHRFIPILTYSSPNVGKKEIAQKLYGVRFPDRSKVQSTIGRLIVWSNDFLLDLAGTGFASTQHVAQFLWESQDELPEPAAS